MAEYIKREDAYKTLTEYYHHSTEVQHYALREAIMRVPYADVAPVVHGRWINTMPYVEYKSFCQVKCSVCESIEPYGNFCRNCGADMRGE